MLKKYNYLLLLLSVSTLFTGCSIKYHQSESSKNLSSLESSNLVDNNLKTDELTFFSDKSKSIMIQNLPIIVPENKQEAIQLPIKLSRTANNLHFRLYAKQGDRDLVINLEKIGDDSTIEYFQLVDSTTPVYFKLSDISTNQTLFERTYYLN